MGTDALAVTPNNSSILVDLDSNSIMSISLTIDTSIQKLGLNSMVKVSDSGVSGILFKVNTSGTSPLRIDLKNYKTLAGNYNYVELELSNGRKPNPRVAIKYIIPN
jgi:hypothetical protein